MELLLKSSAPLCRCFFPPQNGENEAVIEDMSEWHAAIGAEKDDRLHCAALHCEGCNHEALLSSTRLICICTFISILFLLIHSSEMFETADKALNCQSIVDRIARNPWIKFKCKGCVNTTRNNLCNRSRCKLYRSTIAIPLATVGLHSMLVSDIQEQ